MKALTALDIARPRPIAPPQEIIYPESDGLPMADNTKQFRVITTLQGNLNILYQDDPLVLVVGDLFWYPVEGNNKIKRAPDVMVAFGVVKGDRRSYLQWKENNIVPQVVFEIRSHSNTDEEMIEKRIFYEDYGVEEYYMYDPDRGTLEGWQRRGRRLRQIGQMRGWVSLRLNIRFDLIGSELQVYYPDGQPFLSFLELEEQRQIAKQRADQAEQRVEQAEKNLQAEAKARTAEAEARAEAEKNLQAEAKARAEAEARLREAEAKLRELGLL